MIGDFDMSNDSFPQSYSMNANVFTYMGMQLSRNPDDAPGTGTPVVGGLSTDRALKIVRGLQGLNLVGMDIVEVAPSYDHAGITALAAATLGLEMLYVLSAGKE